MIFISHSTSDDDFVDKLVDRLTKLGYETWVDHHDAPTGSHWDDVVDEKLRSCSVLILVASDESIASENVKVEWYDAKQRGKPILPIKVKDCELPLLIRHRNFLDFTRDDLFEFSFAKLYKTLKLLVPVPQRPQKTKVAPQPMVTAALPPSLYDRSLERITQEVEQLKLDVNSIVGQDQILFAIPKVGKSLLIDIDLDKMFIGWFDARLGIRPDVDLQRYGALDYGVSRQHATLTKIRGGLTITDLGSTNGTLINDEMAIPHQPTPLKNQDIIYLGNLPMQIFFNLG